MISNNNNNGRSNNSNRNKKNKNVIPKNIPQSLEKLLDTVRESPNASKRSRLEIIKEAFRKGVVARKYLVVLVAASLGVSAVAVQRLGLGPKVSSFLAHVINRVFGVRENQRLQVGLIPTIFLIVAKIAHTTVSFTSRSIIYPVGRAGLGTVGFATRKLFFDVVPKPA